MIRERTTPAAKARSTPREGPSGNCESRPGVLDRSIPLVIAVSPAMIVPLTPVLGTTWAVGICVLIVLGLAALYGRRVGWVQWLSTPSFLTSRTGRIISTSFATIVGLFYLGLVLVWVLVPARGSAECRQAVDAAPEFAFLRDRMIKPSFGTRKYDGHWIVGVQATPSSLASGQGSVLVVCHYQTGSFHTPIRLELLDPAQEGHVRRVSRSVYRSWWPAEN